MSSKGVLKLEAHSTDATLWKDQDTGEYRLEIATKWDDIRNVEDIRKLIRFLKRCEERMSK